MEESVKQIIEQNIYCTIATATLNGKPWISPVFFGYDEKFNIYWISNKDSFHSKLILENPNVSIVIFNSQEPEGEGDAVYMEANAVELTDLEEIEKGIEVRDRRAKVEKYKVKKIDDVTGGAVWRIYRATPSKIYKLTEGEYIKGQYTDKKVEISLK